MLMGEIMNYATEQTHRKFNADWLQSATVNYVNHMRGEPIRSLARSQGCNPSTVSRQVNRIKALRSDPEVDQMIADIKRKHQNTKGLIAIGAENEQESAIIDCLKRSGAVVVCSENMVKSVVVLEQDGTAPETLMVVQSEVIVAMAMRGVLHAKTKGKLTKYHLLSAPVPEAKATAVMDQEEASYRPQTETPLMMLARRADKFGKPFLSRDLSAAGQRLREDFEIASLGTCSIEDIEKLSLGKITPKGLDGSQKTALKRSKSAIAALGPGLSEIALRCCCFCQGLETAEQKMGWSARSGKIVLRIALQRLRLHYQEMDKIDGGLIG